MVSMYNENGGERQKEQEKLLEVYLNTKIIRLVCMRVQTGTQRLAA